MNAFCRNIVSLDSCIHYAVLGLFTSQRAAGRRDGENSDSKLSLVEGVTRLSLENLQ